MKFNKILIVGIADAGLEEKYWQEVKALAGKIVSLPKGSPDIEKELPDTDCTLTGFGVEVSKRHIDLAPDLKYIGVLATAYGKVDIEHAKKKNIPVCNLGGYSTESVAEFTIAAILEAIRGLSEAKARPLKGDYSEGGIRAREIKGKVFAVIGLGSIGGRVAEIAQGFGADVRYWSRTQKTSFDARGIKYEDLDSLLKAADFISINLAETAETTGMFDEKKMSSLKPGAVMINTAPMEIVDLEALENRLSKGDITFILDHSDQMKEMDVKALIKHSNCIAYPPIAYISDEAKRNRQETFVNNLKNFCGGNVSNRVN